MNAVLKTVRTEYVNFKMNNIKISPNTKFDLKPTFSRNCRKVVENELINFVDLELKIESSPDAPKPFDLDVKITGIFECVLTTDEDKKKFQIESTQILYPYLRTMVSGLSAVTCEMPIMLPILKDGILFPEDANGNVNQNKSGFMN